MSKKKQEWPSIFSRIDADKFLSRSNDAFAPRPHFVATPRLNTSTPDPFSLPSTPTSTGSREGEKSLAASRSRSNATEKTARPPLPAAQAATTSSSSTSITTSSAVSLLPIAQNHRAVTPILPSALTPSLPSSPLPSSQTLQPQAMSVSTGLPVFSPTPSPASVSVSAVLLSPVPSISSQAAASARLSSSTPALIPPASSLGSLSAMAFSSFSSTSSLGLMGSASMFNEIGLLRGELEEYKKTTAAKLNDLANKIDGYRQQVSRLEKRFEVMSAFESHVSTLTHDLAASKQWFQAQTQELWQALKSRLASSVPSLHTSGSLSGSSSPTSLPSSSTYTFFLSLAVTCLFCFFDGLALFLNPFLAAIRFLCAWVVIGFARGMVHLGFSSFAELAATLHPSAVFSAAPVLAPPIGPTEPLAESVTSRVSASANQDSELSLLDTSMTSTISQQSLPSPSPSPRISASRPRAVPRFQTLPSSFRG